MDFWTKVFLINLVVITTTAVVDKLVLKDWMENTKYLVKVLGAWVLITAASFPVYLIYAIVRCC